MKRFFTSLGVVSSLGALALAGLPLVADAATGGVGTDAAGQNISNTATATYQDNNNNFYATTSNTLIVTVQNVPNMTITGIGGKNYSPGSTVSDSFSVTNTGNGPGYLQIVKTATSVAGTSCASAITAGSLQYVVNNGTTSVGPLTADQMNAYLNGTGSATGGSQPASAPITIPAGGVWTVSVQYPAPGGSGCSGSYTVTLGATITQPDIAPHADSGSSFNGQDAPAESTQTISATTTPGDTVGNEATLDLQLVETDDKPNGRITMTVYGANSGSVPLRGLSSAQAIVSGAGGPGIMIVQRVPVYNNNPLGIASVGNMASGATSGFHILSGQSAQLFYSTTASGNPSTWKAGTPPSDGTVTYVGYFIPCGTSGSSFGSLSNSCLDPGGHATGEGNVPVSSAQLSFPVTYNAPVGSGSSDTSSVKTAIANGVGGGNQSVVQLLGPGITTLIQDTSGSQGTAMSAEEAAFANVTADLAPTGASNKIDTQGFAMYAVFNGPKGAPEATGTLDGVTTPDNNGDFTALVLQLGCGGSGSPCTSTVDGTFVPTTGVTSFAGAKLNVPAGTAIAFTNTVENTGSGTDTFNLTGNVSGLNPSGSAWGVQFLPGGCTAPDTGTCKPITTITVGSHQTADYVAYYSTTGTSTMPAYTPFKAIVTATSKNDPSTSPASNQTYNVILANGFIGMTKTAAVTTSTCPSGVTPGYSSVNPAVCSGSIVKYSVNYFNYVPDPSGTGNVYPAVKPGTNVVITEDGSASGTSPSNTSTPGSATNWQNNWASYASLAGSPSDSNGSATASSNVVTDVISASSITPQKGGTLQFSVTVK